MHGNYFDRYMSAYDTRGRSRCSCGLEHELDTRRIVLRDGALGEAPRLVRELHGTATRIWVLSDENTERAAGETLKERLAGFPLAATVLPAEPRPRCTPELADRLTAEARRAEPGLIVSVGGGTLSDLGKKVSTAAGIPNWTVMTAPSADAQTSRNANLKSSQGAVAVPVSPSRVVLAEPAVLRDAPRLLFLSGLGDLLAKFLAALDWRIGAWVIREPYCPVAAEAALGSAREALAAAAIFEQDPALAAGRLGDALLTSGLTMQALGHSRPAASAEHTAGHLWETSHVVREASHDLHGLIVGLASRLILPVYREFFRMLETMEIDVPARLRALRVQADPAERDAEQDELIRPHRAQLQRVAGERAATRRDPQELLRRIENHRPEILKLAGGMLDELEAGVRVLEKAGYPFALSAYGITEEEAMLPFRYLRLLRNRFSSFDVMHLLGVEPLLLESLRREIRLAG